MRIVLVAETYILLSPLPPPQFLSRRSDRHTPFAYASTIHVRTHHPPVINVHARTLVCFVITRPYPRTQPSARLSHISHSSPSPSPSPSAHQPSTRTLPSLRLDRAPNGPLSRHSRSSTCFIITYREARPHTNFQVRCVARAFGWPF